MSYTTATDKPEKDLASYQSVRSAELRSVYRRIAEADGQLPVSQVLADFTKPAQERVEQPTENTLQLLRALDFIDRPSTRTIELIEDQPFAELPFELRVFHHYRQQEGTQDHFTRMHNTLAGMDQRFVDKSEFEEELERELDRYPFEWNVQKVQTWYNLVGPLGLVSVRDNQEILTSPSQRVVYDLLEAFEAAEGSNRLAPCLDWVEEHFFRCSVARAATRKVHVGLAETLCSMARDGAVTFRSPSDARTEVAIPGLDADAVSSFALDDRPDMPAYEYPMDAFEREVPA